MVQSFLKIRSAQRQQRPLRQVPEVKGKPESAETDRRNDVEPGHGEVDVVPGLEVGFDEREDVHRVHEDDVDGDGGNRLLVLLELLREEQQEREDEMSDQENEADPAPSAVPALD